MTRFFWMIAFILFTAVLLPGLVMAQCTPGQSINDNNLCNPIVGAGNLKQFLLNSIAVLGAFLWLTPLIGLCFAGLLMVTSQGNEETISRAKATFTWTIYGFLLATFSFVLVSAMSTFLGARLPADPLAPPTAQPTIVNPLTDIDFVAFLTRMLTGFLGLVMTLAILMLIVNGFRYITSGGNEEQAKQGREGVKWALLGIIASMLSYVILRAVANLIGLP